MRRLRRDEHARVRGDPSGRPEAPAEYQDLGLGARISADRRRLINPDGSFNVVRRGLGMWTSLSIYQWLLTLSWPGYFLLVALCYLVANSVFGTIYWLLGPQALAGDVLGGAHGAFLTAFFFSVETFSTIGYGHVAPHTLGANVVVAIESLAGLMTFAVITGVLLARVARPTARIIASREAIIAPYRGLTSLQLRLANGRRSQLTDVRATVVYTAFAEDGERRLRQYHPLSLERASVMFLPLSWTVVHPITQESPLWGLTPAQLAAREAEVIVLLQGFDETFGQSVQTRLSYGHHQLRWGMRFRDIFVHDPTQPLTIDLARLHDLEPAALPSP